MIKTNQILKKLQTLLGVDNTQMHAIFELNGYKIPQKRVDGYLSIQGSKEFLDCGYEPFGEFLDGLIVYKRGEIKSKSVDRVSLTNNIILKKLRVAFDLKESDLFEIFKIVDLDITKGELSSLFRSEDHKKFRYCPDSILLLFVEGLMKHNK
jgi:uncharacterized protein YehS (DUF1456 family)